MDNVSYTDPTPNNFPDDYDPSQVDARIKLRSESLKHKEYGKHTREALYQGIEIGGVIAGEAKNVASEAKSQSQSIDDRFDAQIAGSTNDNEVIDGRLGFPILRDVIKQKAYQFSSIGELQTSKNLLDGDYAVVKSADGGEAYSYSISALDAGQGIPLQNNLFANLILTNGQVNVLAFSGETDVEKLSNAVAYIGQLDNTHGLTLMSSSTLAINESTVIDCASKTFDVNLRIKPAGGIGSALVFKNGIAMHIKIMVDGGGNDTNTDAAIEVNTMSHCIVHIDGSYYKGTLFKVSGKDSDSTHCIGMQVTLRNYNCNRTLIHGDEVYPASGFGYYDDVWEETWDASKPEGSIIRGTYDVSFGHYESHFVTSDPTQTDLSLSGVYSCYFGYLALGGKCSQLLNIGYNCDVSIDSLHLGSEDGTNVNGLNVGGGAYLNIRQFKAASVGVALNYATGTTVQIGTLMPSGTIGVMIQRDNKNLGYAHRITGFTNLIPTKIVESKEYQVYKETFTNLPIVEGGTNPSGTPYPWYYENGIVPTFSTSSLDNINNASSLKIVNSTTSSKKIYINFPIAQTEQPVFNVDLKAINLATDSKVVVTCDYLDINNQLLRQDILRTIDGSQISYQQFNFEAQNLVPDIPPSGVSYFRFNVELTNGSSTSMQVVISQFAIRKSLAH